MSWKILDGWGFPPFKHPRDCADTIDGRCERGLTLDQCIDKCEKSPLCDAGYFIKGDPSLCLPLVTFNYPEANPAYGLIRSTKNITAFINEKKFPFPPDEGNQVFFKDRCVLVNVETERSVSSTDERSPIQMSKDGGVEIIVFGPRVFWANELIEKVNYKEKIAIAIPKTSHLIRKKGKILQWVPRMSWNLTNEDLFTINGGNGVLNYNEPFYMTYEGSIVGLNKNSELQTFDRSSDLLREAGVPYLFKLKSRMPVFICDGECRQTTLDRAKISRGKARIDGKVVYRSSRCFDLCPKKKDNRNVLILFLVLFIVVFLFLLIRS